MFKNAIWLFVITVVIVGVFIPSYSNMQDLKDRNAQYQARIIELEAEKESLALKRKLLEDDPLYLERVAREKMGVVREGEVVYKLVPTKTEEK